MTAMAFAYLSGGDADARGFLIVCAIVVAAAALVFGGVFARAKADERRARRSALWLGGLSVITFPVFWLGLPLVLGPAAVLLGRGRSTVAVVLGSVATLAALVAALMG